jgi:secreted Zn-dependent insulinase-like peptidase
LAYSKTEHKFKLTGPAIQKIKTLFDKTPFAVTVDKQVVYYGFFKPAFSSSSCEHSITMDVAWASGNEIYLKLGYPAQLPGITIEDKRNDPTLLATLRKQGKLQ